MRHLEPLQQRPQLVAPLLPGGDDDPLGRDQLDPPVLDLNFDPVGGDLPVRDPVEVPTPACLSASSHTHFVVRPIPAPHPVPNVA